MTFDAFVERIIIAIAGGLIGGGAIAGVFYRALKDRLREDLAKTFASIGDLNGVGSRLNALETVTIMARDNADANSDLIIRLDEGVQADRRMLTETLTRINLKLDQMDRAQREDRRDLDRTVALLDALEKRIDRHEK